MAYIDYLPSIASIGSPVTKKASITVNNIETEREFFDCGSIKFFKNAAYTESEIIDTTPEYSIGGGSDSGKYKYGDEVQVSSLKIKYRYALDVSQEITSANFDEFHPSAININNERINYAMWVAIGHIDEYKPLNGSSESYLTASNNMRIEVDLSDWTYTQREDGFIGLHIDGIAHEEVKYPVKIIAYVTIYEGDGTTVQDTFYEFIYSGGRFFMRVPVSNGVNPEERLSKISIFLSAGYATSVSIPIEVSVGSVSVSFMKNIGLPLYGIDESSVTTFKDVISDGIVQEVAENVYDTVSSSVLVDKPDLKKVKSVLRKSCIGGNIFFIGASDEDYSDIAYYGRIKYNTPIKNASGKYEIKIDCDSRPYYAQNRFVTPDSTDGYAQ